MDWVGECGRENDAFNCFFTGGVLTVDEMPVVAAVAAEKASGPAMAALL